MRIRRSLFVFPALLLAATLAFAQSSARSGVEGLPTPEQYLGFRVGTDRKLATWNQVVNYMRMASQASNRVRFEEMGKSTMGHPFVLLAISSPQNLARLEEIRADQRKLAYPYDLDQKAAAEIIAKNPAVILITLTIHSSEIGSTQMSLELVHRLATEQSPYIQNLLDNVVFLLAPSVNPDGQVLVVDWYNKNLGTEFEYAPMPWLYHKYTGHDDNRDAYMLTQVETRYVTKILYKDWFPLVFLDEHQMGSSGPRIFVPPFDDPINPNIDAAVIAGSNLMGMQMFNALNKAEKEGVIYSERYNWWWQGSAKNGAWYHNMLGLLTEVASARIASPIEQQRAELGRTQREAPTAEGGGGGGGDPRRPLAPPTDTWPRTNYPRPWLGGLWTLRDIVDYERIITYALIEASAAHRSELQRNFYTLNRKAIEAGKKGDPFAYIVPADQHDPGAAAKMLEVLDLAGIEIYRATAAFEADGRKYGAGSYVIPMAQPFRNYAKDLLEPQKYPMKPTAPGQAPERPYDVTGWTLPLQMGVAAVKVDRPFEVNWNRLTPGSPEGQLQWLATSPKSHALVYLIPHESNASARLVNRLLRDPVASKNVEVAWATEEFLAGGRRFPMGTILVWPRMYTNSQMEKLAAETGVNVAAVQVPVKVPTQRLRAPRLGLYQPWNANMDEGWTRWLLEQYEFPYTTLHNDDIRAGKLAEKFDVILFASQSKNSILNGTRGAWQRPEYRGGIGEDGSRAIQEFVRGGGTLVTLDDAADFAIDELGLPVRNVLRGVPSDKFYCPGAILKILVDNKNPLAYGMPEESSAYFLNSPAFELSAPFSENVARAVVKYPSTNALQSGWLGGPEYLYDRVAVADVSYGKGRVVLLGFRAQFRAQPHATFKLLFNAIHGSAATK